MCVILSIDPTGELAGRFRLLYESTFFNGISMQRSFYVDSNINHVPVFGLWCTHFRESAPLIISILASVVLSGAI